MRLIDADKLKPDFIHGRLESRYVSEQDILDAPTVDAVPVAHGHWEETPIPIWLRNNTTRTYYFKCNKCSSKSWNRDNYCSHCGAKMDEVTK